MLKNIRKLNTGLCLTYIICMLCVIILASHAIIFSKNAIKASAQEYVSKNQVEAETIEIKQSNDISTVNHVDSIENVEDLVIDKAAYLAENYISESPLTDEELDLLARVIHAESGNQDEKGKRLVADTVLNRMAFNNADIRSIVYDDGQFTTAPYLYNNNNSPTEDELRIAYEESIEQLNYEVYYFRTGHYHENLGTPAFQWGAHYFSTH